MNELTRFASLLACAGLILTASRATAATPIRSLPLSFWAPSGDHFKDTQAVRGVDETMTATVSVCWHSLPAGAIVRVTAIQSGELQNRTAAGFRLTADDGEVGEGTVQLRYPKRIPGKRRTVVIRARVWLPAGVLPDAGADSGIFLCGSR